jgi:Flp pilus assembly protein TadD
LPPPDPNTLASLGAVLARKGRFDEGIRCLNEALRIDPSHANAENNLGYVYELQHRMPEAIAHYEAALKIQPNHPDATRNLRRLAARASSTKE